MSNDDFQRRLDFMVEQQARLVVNQEKADERLTRLENVVANAYVDMRDRVNALVEAQLKSEQKIAALADAQSNLVQSQAATDERLNVLITVVERHITGNNGSPRGSGRQA